MIFVKFFFYIEIFSTSFVNILNGWGNDAM